MQWFFPVFLSCLMVLGPAVSKADNPDSTNLRLKVSGSETTNRIGTNIRVRATHIFNEVLEEGTACDVTLSACIQTFIPARLEPDRTGGRCDAVAIATVNMVAGQQKAVFRTYGPPLAVKRAGRARQISFQTQSECIDTDSTQATIFSPPRARKSSRKDRVGRSNQIVFARFAKRVRVSID